MHCTVVPQVLNLNGRSQYGARRQAVDDIAFADGGMVSLFSGKAWYGRIHHDPEDTVESLKEAGCNRVKHGEILGHLADIAARTDPELQLTVFPEQQVVSNDVYLLKVLDSVVGSK